MMPQDKYQAREVRIDNRFSRWFDNFWYHYKWVTLFVLLAVVVLVIGVWQIATREDPEYVLMYAGPGAYSELKISSMEQGIASLTGDEETDVHIYNYYILSSKQIEEVNAQGQADGTGVTANTTLIAMNRESFHNTVLAGNAVIMLLDPHLYAELRDQGLKSIADYVPAGTEAPFTYVDETCMGVYLSQTALADLPAFSDLPEDTIVCIRSEVTVSGMFNTDKAREEHARYTPLILKVLGLA